MSLIQGRKVITCTARNDGRGRGRTNAPLPSREKVTPTNWAVGSNNFRVNASLHPPHNSLLSQSRLPVGYSRIFTCSVAVRSTGAFHSPSDVRMYVCMFLSSVLQYIRDMYGILRTLGHSDILKFVSCDFLEKVTSR